MPVTNLLGTESLDVYTVFTGKSEHVLESAWLVRSSCLVVKGRDLRWWEHTF